jgi:hypothetical protein
VNTYYLIGDVLLYLVIGWGVLRYYIVPTDRRLFPDDDLWPRTLCIFVHIFWVFFGLGFVIASQRRKRRENGNNSLIRSFYGVHR